ncbi:hypothetical protein I302_105842 [Kwoniella bestiolae CBS 10118]|uniref:Spindle pole body component n=1 Tax=Kwoniella bestiolae CBS 10118 TaxID=1296100 RepID=A0A1B9G2A8_9TREE|nr:hypothetical protein I302_04964 [Kwoniella bestiolae CBS 10118]OCF25154.1 hypothetical protein I302_04964 [Kwoniella bestiolae CBS 10118]
MTTLFQLAPIPLTEESNPFASSSKLPNIQPRFVLPPLDDHISGTERLLGSLRGTSRYALQNLNLDNPPSPSRAQVPAKELRAREEVLEGLGEGVNQDNIWERAITQPEAETGPSRRKVFEPLRTWDDIDLSRTGTTPFLSEKSTFTFDSLLTSLEPPITLPKLGRSSGSRPIPVHDPKTLLELMMRSTLGTTTTKHLKWNSRKARFVWSAEGGRPIGIERVTGNSMIEWYLDIGTSIRRLEMIVDSQSTLALTPTHHALLHGLSTYLTFIKERLTTAIEENARESHAGWNKWLGATKDVRELGETLCEVMCWPLSSAEAFALPSKSSALLSHIYNHLLASISTSTSTPNTPLTLALAFLFNKSIGPFLNLLRAWIGLADSSTQDEDADPTSQPWLDLGITRRLTSSGTWEYTFSSRKMPSFVPKSDRRTFFEAGKNLRLLREASDGSHPLCSGDWGLDHGFGWGEGSSSLTRDLRSNSRRVKREINHWRRAGGERSRSLLGSTSSAKLRLSHGPRRKERKPLSTELFSPPSPLAESFQPTGDTPLGAEQNEAHLMTGNVEMDELWTLFNQHPGSHLNSQLQQERSIATTQIWQSTPLEQLHSFLSCFNTEPLLPSDSPTLPIFISSHLLSPLLSHSRLISTSLVSLYLDDLNFLDHLDILYSYFLGGDVNFLGRVSDSLFGKDNAGAGEAMGLGRRARTRVRLGLDPITAGAGAGGEVEGEWGIGLGVGLSERSRWPPGGSELAYALRTTLMDDRHTSSRSRKGGPWDEVQDRISFAIRQLDGEDRGRRAKWLDPQAIEALDFLYLSYSPPSAITPLLPTTLLAKYQTIHNLILRLSRCQIVFRTMYWSVLHQSEHSDDFEPTKTGVDSGLNRPSSRTTLRKSRERVVNTLFPPRSNIERKVQVLRFRMAHLVNALGEYIDNVINHKWNGMKRRLERLQQKSRSDNRETSRPSSPTPSEIQEDEGNEYLYTGEYEDDEDEEEGDMLEIIDGLKSPHSLILYHQITLTKILNSCLLNHERSQGQQVTFKILMSLLKMILELGKVLVEVERGLVGWMEGSERVGRIEEEWEERERVFLHALERLSLRTRDQPRNEESDAEEEGEKTEEDLQILFSGSGEDGTRRGKGEGEGDDLKELLLRLKLGYGEGQYR